MLVCKRSNEFDQSATTSGPEILLRVAKRGQIRIRDRGTGPVLDVRTPCFAAKHPYPWRADSPKLSLNMN